MYFLGYDNIQRKALKNCTFVSVLWKFFLYGNEPSLKVNTKILYSLAEDIYYIVHSLLPSSFTAAASQTVRKIKLLKVKIKNPITEKVIKISYSSPIH